MRSVSTSAAVHEVRPGDTLTYIAEAYGVRVDRLARANRMRDPSRLEVGARLVIPDRGRLVHRVLPGETLADVAARYGVGAAAIARTNRLRDPARLEPGRRLVLPIEARLPPRPPRGDDPGALGRDLVRRAEEHYLAARFDRAIEAARRAESLLAGRAADGPLRAQALFVLGSALAGVGREDEAARAFAASRAADPRFVPPQAWLSPRLEELYRAGEGR